MSKTYFSFEVPTKHLEDFSDLQDYYFCLSMLCKSQTYVAFHRQQALYSHKQVWLDNSFNETFKADSLTVLHSAMLDTSAHKLIVPDDPKWSTDQIACSFEESCKLIPASRLITVVNSEEMHEELFARGAIHFALSYHIRLPQYNRGLPPGFFEWARGFHFLGLCSIEEIQILQPPTCDTSMPIKLALRGWDLRKWFELGQPHIHTKDIVDSFFDCELSPAELQLARNNIIMLKEVCNG